MTVQPAPEDVRRLLAQGTTQEVAAALLAVVDDEDARQARNALPPYADVLPPLLAATAPQRVAEVLEVLTGAQAQRLLFGSFRQIPWPWLGELAVELSDDVLLRLLRAMAPGVDAPRSAARLIAARAAADPEAAARALVRLEPDAAARVLGLAPMGALVALLGHLAASPWSAQVHRAAMPGEAARLQTAGTPGPAEALEPAPLAVPGQVLQLEALTPQAAAAALIDRSAAWQLAVLTGMAAGSSGRVLSLLAQVVPERCGMLLGGLSEWPLVQGPSGLRRTLFRARAAAVLRAVGPAEREELLGLVDPRVAPGLSGRVSRRHPVRYPQVSVRSGVRRRRRIFDGVDLVSLREQVDTPGGPLPLRVDLLELDRRRIDVRVRRGGTPVPFARLVDEVSATGRGGTRPDERVFRQLGLVRLAEVVAEQQACAAVNGNFYIDYGHYLDGLDLGIDLAGEPHVLLGDTIGWFVSGGRELAAPVVHRGTLVVTEGGDVHILRVFVRGAVVRGRELSWDRVDVPGPGRVLYTRLHGEATPVSAEAVELVVSGGVVVEVRSGGGTRIPLLGFVLALPRQQAQHLRSVRPGDPVGLPAGLPAGIGPVREAMSCGPLLVRDGEVDLDLACEGFGDKDTGVLPLSLTRAVDSFLAARSFVMTRGEQVVLGTVSGTQVGMGPVEISVGVTFGELAQLCVDLGADDAMGLDGGGSSALVAGTPGGSTVVNVPTGGSDVPPGTERFLSTYLLGVPRTAG